MLAAFLRIKLPTQADDRHLRMVRAAIRKRRADAEASKEKAEAAAATEKSDK